MCPDNLYKYLYFLVLMLLVVGYILFSGIYLKYKFTKTFYIRMSILIFLFYVLSDNLLYTILFGIFILISVNIYHKNSIIEGFKENLEDDLDDDLDEQNIELYNNKKTIEDFYEYSNKLLANEAFINDSKNSKNNTNIKIDSINKKLKKIKNLMNENK